MKQLNKQLMFIDTILQLLATIGESMHQWSLFRSSDKLTIEVKKCVIYEDEASYVHRQYVGTSLYLLM